MKIQKHNYYNPIKLNRKREKHLRTEKAFLVHHRLLAGALTGAEMGSL